MSDSILAASVAGALAGASVRVLGAWLHGFKLGRRWERITTGRRKR
jgi:hypothetical protein